MFIVFKSSPFNFSLVLCLCFLICCSKYQAVKERLDFAFPDYIKCKVVKVINGDTFDCQLTNIQIERVKLIGVRIPSSFERRATDFSSSYLRIGLPVKLEPDEVTYDGINILAYLYLPGGKMLNALLIKEGYAEYNGTPPNVKYEQYLMSLEKEAKEHKRGLWNNEK